MKLRVDHVQIVLQGNRPLALRRAHGSRLVCSEGCAWITVTGNAKDFFLGAGDSFAILSDDLVLAEAVGRATVRVETATARDWFGVTD